jgi:hypothetical protein
MSKTALTPVNVPVSATNISTPTLRSGDMYFNTVNGLMIYTGSAWIPAGFGNSLDGGVFDSIAPVDGGNATTAATQTFEGGTP